MHLTSSAPALPAGVIVGIVVLGVIEVALDVVALVVLVRTPRQRVTLPKWAWALLIIVVNLIGAILFLAIGRRPASAMPPTSWAPPEDRASASEVADALYGGMPGGGTAPGRTASVAPAASTEPAATIDAHPDEHGSAR